MHFCGMASWRDGEKRFMALTTKTRRVWAGASPSGGVDLGRNYDAPLNGASGVNFLVHINLELVPWTGPSGLVAIPQDGLEEPN